MTFMRNINSSGMILPTVSFDNNLSDIQPLSSWPRNLKKATVLFAIAARLAFPLGANAEGPVDGGVNEWVSAGGDPMDKDAYLEWAGEVNKSRDEIYDGMLALNFYTWRSMSDGLCIHDSFSVGRAGIFRGGDASFIQYFEGYDPFLSDELNLLLRKATFSDSSLTLPEIVRINQLLQQEEVDVLFAPFGVTEAEIQSLLDGNMSRADVLKLLAKMKDSENVKIAT